MESIDSKPSFAARRRYRPRIDEGARPTQQSARSRPDRLKSGKNSIVPAKIGALDIRRWQLVLVEIGFVLALSILLAIVRLPLRFEREAAPAETLIVYANLEEVEQTEQVKRPPPPPRPPVPISVPDDAVLSDEPIDIDAEIRIDEPLQLPPPPPPQARASKDIDEPEIFVVVEEMPELIGGLAALHEALVYPDLAVRAGIEGLVVVQLVIETDGTCTGFEILKSGGALLDTAALEAAAKLRFKPGRQRGKPVRVRYALPIRFELRSAEADS